MYDKREAIVSEHVITGDSAVVLGHFPDDYFHAVITDPPWGLSFMQQAWDNDLPQQAVWDETFRVLKPGGHVWVMASDRPDCFVGFYLALKRAGFAIDNSQFVVWVQLQGMPKSNDISKQADKEAFRKWLDYVGAELTPEERRKAESTAVNGCYSSAATRDSGTYYYEAQEQKRPWYSEQRSGKLTADALLSSILSSHWPSSPSEQRAQWEAVVGEVPEGWDTSRPPGVRVKTGEYKVGGTAARRAGTGGVGAFETTSADSSVSEVTASHSIAVTQPSTPLAAEWDGWRGSVAPFRPLASLILHAQKPWKGSYLRCAEEHGTGSVNVAAGRIPFREGDGYNVNVLPAWSGFGQLKRPDYEPRVETRGRVPGNLLTYSDLLGELTHQADLDAWAERLGLPTASAELLEAGVCYCPKPSKQEKEHGLGEEFPAERAANPNYGKGGFARPTGQPERMIAPQRNQHPTCKPISLCAFLVALSTREGDRVLDPFLGSGTTLVAAKMLGREGVGIELSEEYAAIARARIEAAEPIAAPEPRQLELAGGAE